MSRIAKVFIVLGLAIISSGCSAQPAPWPSRPGFVLAISMPPSILFDLKPGQAIPPDSWVLLKSFDERPPWHHTDLFLKELEAKQSPDQQKHLYRLEYGWTGELPQLSAQTPARYWMDEMMEADKSNCPGETVKIIRETGQDADGGSEVVFEVIHVACPRIQDNDQIVRILVEAPTRNHPVFMFKYVVKSQMTVAEREEAIKLVSSHRILSKPWPDNERYLAVNFPLQ